MIDIYESFDEFTIDQYCSVCKHVNLPHKLNVCHECIMATENSKTEEPYYFSDMRKKEENKE